VSPARHEIDWVQDRPSLMPRAREAGGDVEAAEHALGVNRLQDAIQLAERAVGVEPPALAGRMWLVQAISHRWLGNYAAAEYCALEATRRLPHGSGGWYAALGYYVIASGYLGKSKQVLSSLEEVKRIEVTEEKVSLHVIILCRLAIFLTRAGYPNVAHRILLDAEGFVAEDDALDSIVRAWLEAARAEAAMHQGDLTSCVRRIEATVESFTAAGDVRNACLQRANIGNGYMQLGAYRRAAAVLHEALSVAEPMKLDFVPHVKVNLGFVLAQLGQLDKALEVERAALDHCIEQHHRRFEGCSRIYLATIYSMRGEVEHATTVAQQAVDMLDGTTDMRAYALATLAKMMHMQKQPALALRYAREAMDLMHNLGGVEEGEALIRTVYALALRATGNEPEGRREIAEARRRLLERADRIGDPNWRQSFLEGVRDNARAIHLAAQWLDQDGAPVTSRR
jgi:tetratricopeptide (TPR) repeat protein